MLLCVFVVAELLIETERLEVYSHQKGNKLKLMFIKLSSLVTSTNMSF